MRFHLNVRELAADIVGVFQQYHALSAKVSSATGLPLDSQDARVLALDCIQQDLVALSALLYSVTDHEDLVRARIGIGWQKTYLASLGCQAFPPDDKGIAMANHFLLEYLRSSPLVKCQFRVENLLYNLAREITKVPPADGYAKIVGAALAAVGLSRSGSEWQVLRAMACVRNSFHSNGIHRHGDETLAVGGEVFEFKRGQPINCNGWPHIVLLLSECSKSLDVILSSSKVASIKTVIPDAGAVKFFAGGGKSIRDVLSV